MSLRLISLSLVLLTLMACRTTDRQATPSVVPPAVRHSHVSEVGGDGAKGNTQRPTLSYTERRRYDKLFLEAVRQKHLEHIDAQYQLLDAALKINPYAGEALYEMALLKLSYTAYSDTLSRAEGDSLLRKAVALSPDNRYYKETLATYYANSAKYREAIRIYEELAESRPTDEGLATLIWLYKTAGDYAGAIRTIERLERIDGHSEALSMEKFQTYLAMKDDEHAYQAIEDLCAEYPLDLRYRVLLGDLYNQNGHYERALDIYRDVLTAEPDNSYAQLSLLAYYKAAGADSLYLNFLHRVVLNPHTQEGARLEAMRSYAVDNIRAHEDSVPVIHLFLETLRAPQTSRDMAELYAYYLVERALPSDSIESAMQRILSIEPDYSKARLQLLQIYLQRNDMTGAARICREGELYDPAEVTFYYYEGTALYMLGRSHEAIDALQRGAERLTETTDVRLASDLYALLGDVLHESGLHDESYAAYDRALGYNELNLMCLNNYAYFLSLAGKHLDRAERMSRLTIESESDNVTYLDTYAWVCYRMGDYEKARTYIDKVVGLARPTTENASLYDHAGDIYYRLGQRNRAVEYWREALRLTDEAALKRRLNRKVRLRRL